MAAATATPGVDDDRTRRIADVAALAGIRTGTFAVNGVQVAVDVATDTLDDVLQRIQGAVPGVTAGYDTAPGRAYVRGAAGEPLELDDGTSDFFAGLGITAGTFAAVAAAKRRTRFAQPQQLRAGLDEFGKALDDLFGTRYASSTAPAASYVQGKLRGAIAAAFADVAGTSGSERFAAHGLRFDFRAGSDAVLDLNLSELRAAMRLQARPLAAVLGAARDGARGAVERLEDAFAEVERGLATLFGGGLGRNVDRLA